MYKSKRVYLRPFNENDVSKVLEMRMDLEGVKAAGGSPYPSSESGIKKWITDLYPRDNLTYIAFVIAECESNNFVGYCSASNVNYINSNAHVGFFFHKDGRGKGYFKEASILFYSYLFNEINLRKVYSYALSYNALAINADKKIGFTEDGIMKEHIYQSGIYHDAIFLSLTAKDFFNLNNVNDYLVTG